MSSFPGGNVKSFWFMKNFPPLGLVEKKVYNIFPGCPAFPLQVAITRRFVGWSHCCHRYIPLVCWYRFMAIPVRPWAVGVVSLSGVQWTRRTGRWPHVTSTGGRHRSGRGDSCRPLSACWGAGGRYRALGTPVFSQRPYIRETMHSALNM